MPDIDHARIVGLDGLVVVCSCTCGKWTSRLAARGGVMVLADELWSRHRDEMAKRVLS